MNAGMDVARHNYSHGDHAYHSEVFHRVRTASKKTGKFVGNLQDLSGPKIRVGHLPAEGILFQPGDEIHLVLDGATPSLSGGKAPLVPVSVDLESVIKKDLGKKQKVLFDDGKIVGFIKDVGSTDFLVEISNGGVLKSKKGMNFPETPISLPSLTDKDLKDLKLGLDLGVDMVALSFVRNADELIQLKRAIQKQTNDTPLIIPKIERHEAVHDADRIIRTVAKIGGGLMVARGDLAVEVGVERVPVIQKSLIFECNQAGVPVITATQMLDSMTSNPLPTRAEASDVANAVFDGTDAVMLSGETAAGQHPVLVVKTMAEIAEEAERTARKYSTHKPPLPVKGSTVDSVEFSASRIAQALDAVAIVCLTNSGRSAATLSKYRPETKIVALTDLSATLRKLSLYWGVGGIHIPPIHKERAENVEKELVRQGIAKEGDTFVITMGPPMVSRGKTNTVRVKKVGLTEERVPVV